VRALVRASSDTRFLRGLAGVELVEAALRDRSALVEAARGVSAIIHSAGLVKARSEEEFHQVNVGGTENLLEAARATKDTLRRFVFVSSLAAAGPTDADGTPLKSDAPAHPVTRYGRSKRAAERVVLAAKDELPVVVLRPAAIYGPRDREILAFFKAVQNRVFPYFGSAQNKTCLIYGPDCAAACIAAIEANIPSGALHFLEDGNVYTFETMFAAVEKALGRRALVRFPLPRALIHGVATATELYGKVTDRAVMLTRDKTNELFGQFVCDGSDARAALGWEPRVKLEEGARLTANWYREHGWL
jgi:nucleoside-diphosphate-sugar epimerase